MIRRLGQVFLLDTQHTTYAFRVLDTGHLEHLYYGERIELAESGDAELLAEKHAFAPGNTNTYDPQHPQFSLEDMRLEMSSYGKGDIREPFIEVVHADGSFTSDFLYQGSEIREGKQDFPELPGSYEEEGRVQELVVTLFDKSYGLTLELLYFVFETHDVVSRSARLVNTSGETVRLLRLMSTQLDFETDDYILTTFNGSWGREMGRNDTPIRSGKHVNSSYAGCSSNRANPFVMLSKEGTGEESGLCYGLNLIYSGNHYEAAEVNGYHKTRFVSGINPQSFCFLVGPGEDFQAPEAVMAFSPEGWGGMSRIMHRFVRQCICRGRWRDRVRPVLLNSWEAAYFDINESKLLRLARAGKEVGIELFVMDDGWFGKRDDDTSSLGDWTPNPKKLPGGLAQLADKINAMGMEFGIWVEPEMVNTDSELYRAHPDWTLAIPGKPHTEGRNQRILDLANPEAADYVIDSMRRVFSSANIAYVKWDMNRIFSDYYSPYLEPQRQGETAHRYMLGLYRILRTLTEEFPDILFEGCAAGGNRFDLGMLCFFPQIWASDDTDALFRVGGQTGYSYGYPMSAVSAHVSACPNHQTLRTTPLATRFHVAAFGVLGYECNLCDMGREELEEIREEIALYKQWRRVLQYGDFYRGRDGNVHEWTVVSRNRSRAVGFVMQELVQPNIQFEQYLPKGLAPDRRYRLVNRNLRYNIKGFGSLINTVAPIHVKQDSLVHNVIARFVTMPGEREDYTAFGSAMMKGGVKLKQGFAATGYNEEVRYFPDFASRMYFMEEVPEEEGSAGEAFVKGSSARGASEPSSEGSSATRTSEPSSEGSSARGASEPSSEGSSAREASARSSEGRPATGVSTSGENPAKVFSTSEERMAKEVTSSKRPPAMESSSPDERSATEDFLSEEHTGTESPSQEERSATETSSTENFSSEEHIVKVSSSKEEHTGTEPPSQEEGSAEGASSREEHMETESPSQEKHMGTESPSQEECSAAGVSSKEEHMETESPSKEERSAEAVSLVGKDSGEAVGASMGDKERAVQKAGISAVEISTAEEEKELSRVGEEGGE